MARIDMAQQQQMQSIAAALACLAVLYTLMPRLPKGIPLLLIVLPCLPVLAWVPFSTRCHSLRAILSFSLLWICLSKLLLPSWVLAPDIYVVYGFYHFIVATMLPLRIKGKAPTSARTERGALFPHILNLSHFFAVLNACQYRDRLCVWAINALDCILVFLGLQLVLGVSAELANALLRVESYPQFDDSFLASSEFWSRLWNLVASHTLREAVYAPILPLLSRGQHRATVMDVKNSTRSKGGNDAGMYKEKTTTSVPLNESTQTRGMYQNSTSEHQKFQQERSGGFDMSKPPLHA